MNDSAKVILCFLLLIAFVVIGSIISVRMWDETEEQLKIPQKLILQKEMTLQQQMQSENN